MTYLFLLLALVGHAVVWISVVNRLHGLGLQRWIIDGLTVLAQVAFFGIPVLALWRCGRDASLGAPVDSVVCESFLPYYEIACIAALMIAGAQRLYLRFHAERRGTLLQHQISRLDLRKKHGSHLVAAGLPRWISSLPGNQVLQVQVEEKSLAVPNLPSQLEGLRVAHLSDLHMSGRIAVDYFREVVEQTNAWDADLIALTGDLVEYTHCLPWIDDTLAQLRAKQGVYFVLGNHDKKCDWRQLRRLLVEAGLVDLGGACQTMRYRESEIALVGNELPWFHPAGKLSALGEPANPRLTLGLAHTPDQFAWARREGVDLLLAGHNHGGQIRFPRFGALVCPSLYGTRYSCGVFRQRDTVLHVSRGTGSMAPARYFCPSELSLLTLSRRDSSKPHSSCVE